MNRMVRDVAAVSSLAGGAVYRWRVDIAAPGVLCRHSIGLSVAGATADVVSASWTAVAYVRVSVYPYWLDAFGRRVFGAPLVVDEGLPWTSELDSDADGYVCQVSALGAAAALLACMRGPTGGAVLGATFIRAVASFSPATGEVATMRPGARGGDITVAAMELVLP